MNEINRKQRTYQKPLLEQPTQYITLTGVSLPIGTNGFGNDFETFSQDFLERGEQ
jgi:hypothetical protein